MLKFGNDWDQIIKDEFKKEYYLKLRQFLKQEYSTKIIYPHKNDIFNAFKFTSYEDVKVVILGQDPYINEGQAHGLAFSVLPGQKIPPSLKNVFTELKNDLNLYIPNNGYLKKWATQGVFLLNNILTVEMKRSKSHANIGWEIFTNNIIKKLNDSTKQIIFVLWGKDAHQKEILINNNIHKILKAAHPSPMAGGKFFGCKHFSTINNMLKLSQRTQIDWQIKNI